MTDTALSIEGMSIMRSAPEVCLRLEVDALRLDAGETVALTGPSGCGKSTFLDVLAMVLWPDSVSRMEVRLPGNGTLQDVTAIVRSRAQTEAARLRAAVCGYVLQQGGLLPFLTVRENLMVADPLGSQSRRALRSRIEHLASKLDIVRQLDKRPGALSVGERQRAAIVRALIKRPTVLLADEPTANLDPQTSRDTLELLREEAEEFGISVFVVSHDHDLIRGIGLPEWRLEPRVHRHGETGAQAGQEDRTVVISHLHGPAPAAAPDERRPRATAWGIRGQRR